MNHPVRLERRKALAVIVIDNPPVNALSHSVRLGILGALEAALQDTSVTRIILAAKGRTFPAGADIKEFDQPSRAPSLGDLCDIIELSPKPVVAALHGQVLGGGLELAMAAHYRVAAPNTQLGLPEIKLGLLPGAGGTQRAPRLIGARDALGMMLTGTPISAERAEPLGLIDGIVDGDLLQMVERLALELDQPRPTRELRHRLSDGAAFMSATANVRAGLAPGDIAATRIVECVEAALLVPFDAALEMEQQAFSDCLTSEASAGMRHAFFAERRAQKLTIPTNMDARQIGHVAVVGDGQFSDAIALSALNAGVKVTLLGANEASVTATLDRIGEYYLQEAKAGRISQEQGAQALSDLTLTTKVSALAEADFILEGLGDGGPPMNMVMRKIGQVAKAGAVLCANRATVSAKLVGALTGRPQDTILMHFFAPMGRLNVVELGRGVPCDARALAGAHLFAKRLGMMPVRMRGREGLIGTRLLSAYLDAADAFLLKGASPEQVDRAMLEFGMPEGPYQMQDRLSLVAAQKMRLRGTKPILRLQERMVEAGCVGMSVGQGFYIYGQNAQDNRLNEEVMRLLLAERREKNVTETPSSMREIQNTLVAAMANAGAALLEAKTVSVPSDIDAVMLHGMGFPRAKGGPMYQADRQGAFRTLGHLEQLYSVVPGFCTISPLLRKKAAEREEFAS